MSRLKKTLDHKRIRRLIWLVLTIFVLLGYSLQSVAGSAYYSMAIEAYETVSSPPVILQNGTAGTSTIYTNRTSAKVSVAAPVWLSGWDKRIEIEIDAGDVDSSLSSFPVLIYLSNFSSGIYDEDVSCVFDEVGSNSKRIALTVGATAETYVEVEHWDASAEQAWLWANVTASSSSNTTLYLYYDNDHADNPKVGDPNSTPAENVWDSNFKFVSHMRDDPNNQYIRDSTSNNHDGTKVGAGEPTFTTDGYIDDAQNFDGNNDYIQTTSGESKTASSFTWEAWFKTDTTTGAHHMLWQGLSTENGWGAGASGHHEAHINVGAYDTNNIVGCFYGTNEDAPEPADVRIDTTFSDTTNFHHAVFVVTNAGTTPSGNLFLDGSSKGTDTGNQISRTDWNTDLRIGRPGLSTRYFDGIIDEVRVSDVARSAVWIKASYESGRDDLLDFGSEETAPLCGTNYPWPLGGHDLARTGYTDAPAPKSNTTSWIFDAGTTNPFRSGVAVANGTVYLGNDDDNLYALYMVTGAKKWNVNLGGNVRCSPAVSADGTKVYVTSQNGSAFCLNTADGSTVWAVTIGSSGTDQTSSPAVSGNYVVVGANNGTVFCLNAASGAVVWSVTLGTRIRAGAAIEDGKVYVRGQDRYVYCYNLTVASPPTAEQNWVSDSIGSEMYAGYIVVSGNYVFVAAQGDNTVYKLNKADGTTACIYNLPNRPRGGLAVAYGNVYVCYGYSTGTYGVAAFDITTDALKWDFTYSSAADSYNIPVVADGMVFVLATDGYIYALNATTTNSAGEVVWKYNTGATSKCDHASGAVADGRLFIGAGPSGTPSTSKVYSFGDYVLKIVNQDEYNNWTVNLQVYNNSSIERLSSLNISLHDGTSSNQIAISGGSIIKAEGEPYNLPGNVTIYITVSNLQASTSGTSYLYVYLKISVPDTSTYALYIITFEIT